ncbi:Hypothetical protein, putative [Bodo saltans]|uniref:Uncharacterized protein n=1 Tax=Bodo saltans TaxID=75058 RepID=A0A0S4IZG9_BODSA|nr:Hypothetical protein, putative [Bodo saltans]|eukprot:CUG05540.1 Hypothetical protein, putative [Bodo saltans]
MLGGVRATPSMHDILADPQAFLSNKNLKTVQSWTRSKQDDVILFSEITKPVYDAGEAGFLECLRCFGASEVVFLAKGHGIYSAAIKMPKVDTHPAGSSVPKTSLGVNAITRMNKLNNKGNWSFSNRNFGVTIIKLFSEDVHVDDALRLLTPTNLPHSSA